MAWSSAGFSAYVLTIKYDGKWGPSFDGIWEHDIQNGVGIQSLDQPKWFTLGLHIIKTSYDVFLNPLCPQAPAYRATIRFDVTGISLYMTNLERPDL